MEDTTPYGRDNLEDKIMEEQNFLVNTKLPENYSEEELKKFNKWIDLTLLESKKLNKNSIIIDKSDYSLYLIKKGEINSRYNIELGFSPYEDKQVEGDGRTPEGMYSITLKRDRGQTSFYRAFLIDYPNAEDKKKGKTGGLIEIHGAGSGEKGNGIGDNWTLGCAAMSNKDIDEIFSEIKEKDRVTIVRYTDRFKD